MTVMDAPPAEVRFVRCLGCFRVWPQPDRPTFDHEAAMCVCDFRTDTAWIWVDGPRGGGDLRALRQGRR